MMKTAMWSVWGLLIAAMWLGYPLCCWLGIADSVAILSNGLLPSIADGLFAMITLFARGLQCIVAPIVSASTLVWGASRWVL